MSWTAEIGRHFGRAAGSYESAAPLQRLVAARLAGRIADAFQHRAAPRRILEIGCGTGLLTRALRRLFPEALLLASDLAPEMAARTAAQSGGDPGLLAVAMDGARPAVTGGFDLICSSLALQWFADRQAALAGWGALLAPGGELQVATLLDPSLSGWRAAHAAEAARPGLLQHPALAELQREAQAHWQEEAVAIPYPDGLAFLRGLRRIGAHRPAEGCVPLSPGQMRRVLRHFEREHGAIADYRVGYGRMLRPLRRGVFVSGTDTGIGKTLVSACLVRAWEAEYWKPVQTGLAEDPGDSATVAQLAGCPPGRIHPPALELQAPLSPEDAAAAEGIAFDSRRLALPPARSDSAPPLVVEGAGGVLVPMDRSVSTAAMIARFGLPVVLVARSTLGTINHTLLSLEALRARGVVVMGVVLNGPPSPGNRAAIERHGAVRVLAEIAWADGPDAAQPDASQPDASQPDAALPDASLVARLATSLPSPPW